MRFSREPVAVELRTERLILRLPERGDEERMARFYRDNREFLQPWSPSFHEDFFNPAAWRDRIIAIRNEFTSRRGMRLIFLSADDPSNIVGMASLTNITSFPTWSAQLGYSVAAAQEKRGLMTEALSSVLTHAFEELGLHRVEANYIPRNVKSGRVLEKLGFRIEGTSKEYIEIDGRWEDHYRTALLEWEWKAKRPGQ